MGNHPRIAGSYRQKWDTCEQGAMDGLAEALRLRSLGLSVIPIHAPGMPFPSHAKGEEDAGKIPLIEWKEYQQRIPTEGGIRAWWAQWPQANVGVVTGALSGIIVLDVDGEEGRESLKRMNPVPVTRRVATGRIEGGEQLWFRHPGGRVGNFTKRLPGLDLRGDGGYVVAPPSLHRSGRRYEWTISPEEADLADPPEWLLNLIRSEPWRGDGQHRGEIRNWLKLLQGVPEGQRHETAVRIAGHYLGIGRSPEEVEALLIGFAAQCTPPHDFEDIRRIVRDLAEKETAKTGARNSFLPLKGEVGKETNFRPLKAADLLADEPEPIPWVWEPFIPRGGLVLLAAFMKVGKSTFAYALAIAVAQGAPFLDFPTKQGGVLILAVEEHPRDVVRRLRRFGMQPEDPIYVHRGRLDDSPGTLKEIWSFIGDNGITLVILDTLARYWNITDENDNAQASQRVSPLLDLARETEAVVLLVHHERKTGGDDGRGVRGASALVGLVDQALLLDRRQGGEVTHRVLRTIGRYDETPRELILELIGDEYRKLGTPEEVDLEAAKRKVWEALSEEPRDVPTLVKEAGVTEKMTRKALGALGAQIIREGDGVKGDRYTYRRAIPHSIRSQPIPIGEETKFPWRDSEVKVGAIQSADQAGTREEERS